MKIICVGRNYASHARELKNELPSDPVLFLKPETALLPRHMPFFIPDFSKEVHYEAELVIRINKLGKNIDKKFAHKYYGEITLGIDFTARDLQQRLKDKGLPWEKAKAFDGSAAVGKMLKKKDLPAMDSIRFELLKNGESAQQGFSGDMLCPVDELIAYISRFFTLKIGDLIFTGTPAGVGPVTKNDTLTLILEGEEVKKLNVK